MNEMLHGLDQVNWERFAQPTWNAIDEVPLAIRALADGADGDRWRVYNRMLYALGNNHAGTSQLSLSSAKSCAVLCSWRGSARSTC